MPEFPALQALCETVESMPCLRLRLHFERLDGRGALVCDEQVWRGALKHSLDAAVRLQLMPEIRAERGADGASSARATVVPPGLTLHGGSALTLGFHGTAAQHAHAVVQALICAAAGALPQRDGRSVGLGSKGVRGLLSHLEQQGTRGQWRPAELPTSAHDAFSELTITVRELVQASAWPRGAASASRRLVDLVALHIDGIGAVLPTTTPDLQLLVRALWPRMLEVVDAWHGTPSLPARDELRQEAERVAPRPPLEGSSWRPLMRGVSSGRQGARWAQRAYRGVLVFKDVPLVVMRLLQLGQAFGIGQGTTLGHGRYGLLMGPRLL